MFGGVSGGFGGDDNSETNPNPNCPVPQDGSAKAPNHPMDSTGTRIKMWKDMRPAPPDKKDSINAKGEGLYFDNICALPQFWHASCEVRRQ